MGGGIVNLNMLPLETIDRIEIIPDGASAVYGSDAVAGVINVILKDEYEGFRFKTLTAAEAVMMEKRLVFRC